MAMRVNGVRVKHSAVVASLVGFFLACTALILITVESDDRDLDVPYPSPRIAMLQGRQQMLASQGLRGAIAELSSADTHSDARMEQLYHSPWLERIFGKDTTYDTGYITGLKAGDVSVAGYDGLPVAKGVLPSAKDLDLADRMLSGAIAKNTMPAVDNLWDGKPYVPTQAFKDSMTRAWAGFHQAIGEKRWEKAVHVHCGKDEMSPDCLKAVGGTHEGYNTTWNGAGWDQFDGTATAPLKPDSAYGY